MPPNNLFVKQINNQSIMYSPQLFTTASRSSGRFSIPCLKKSAGLAVKKSSSQFRSSASLLKGTPRRLLERESERGDNPMRQGPENRMDMEESPSRAPEWPLSSCLQCVVGRCHAAESLHVVDPGVFAGLLPPEGEVVDNSVQQ
jgi:hypothetical protein